VRVGEAMSAFRCCATRRQPTASSASPGGAANAAVDFASAAIDPPAPKTQAAAPAPAAPRVPARGKAFLESFRNEVLGKDFWDCLESRKPLHCNGSLGKMLAKAMDLDAIVFALLYGSMAGHTGAQKRGEPRSQQSFFMAYLDQSTISLSDAERYFPPLLELCQGLSKEFGYVTARLVLEPPGTKQVPTTAEADVVVLQLWGEQRITVTAPTRGMAMTAPRQPALISRTMLPGDVLYVPTGMEVSAEKGVSPEREDSEDATEGPTMSVILTIRTNEHSVGLSLGKYLNDMLRQQFTAETDEFFRSAVTKSTLPEGHQGANGTDSGLTKEQVAERREALEAKLKKSTAELASKLKATDVRAHFESRMEKLRKEQADSADKFNSEPKALPIPEALTSQSFVRISRGVQCKCVPGDAKALFKRGSETLALPIARTASYLINKLSDGMPHMVETLPCADEMERLCVCQVLVFKECVDVVEEDYRSDAAGAYSGGWGS